MIFVSPPKPPVSGKVFTVDIDQDRWVEVAMTKDAYFIVMANGPGRITKISISHEGAIALVEAMAEAMRHAPCSTEKEPTQGADHDH